MDRTFSHEEYTIPQKYSNRLKWNRNQINFSDYNPTVYSHYDMFNDKLNKGKRIGLVFESQSIFPYQEVERVVNNFDVVFTHSSYLLNKYKNTRWIPGGGIWIGGKVNEKLLGGSHGDIKIYEKTKNISIVSSNKVMCQLHLDRLNLARYLNNNVKIVDTFGLFKGEWIPIIDSLRDYRFSIAIENFIDNGYFTEKILNCFATGTIPIYIGDTNLEKHFNIDGVLRFNSTREIADFIKSEKDFEKLYNSKIEAVKDNFNLCQKFDMIENYIYDNYKEYLI